MSIYCCSCLNCAVDTRQAQEVVREIPRAKQLGELPLFPLSQEVNFHQCSVVSLTAVYPEFLAEYALSSPNVRSALYCRFCGSLLLLWNTAESSFISKDLLLNERDAASIRRIELQPPRHPLSSSAAQLTPVYVPSMGITVEMIVNGTDLKVAPPTNSLPVSPVRSKDIVALFHNSTRALADVLASRFEEAISKELNRVQVLLRSHELRLLQSAAHHASLQLDASLLMASSVPGIDVSSLCQKLQNAWSQKLPTGSFISGMSSLLPRIDPQIPLRQNTHEASLTSSGEGALRETHSSFAIQSDNSFLPSADQDVGDPSFIVPEDNEYQMMDRGPHVDAIPIAADNGQNDDDASSQALFPCSPREKEQNQLTELRTLILGRRGCSPD